MSNAEELLGNNLIYVHDVYGHRYRINADDYHNTNRVQIRLYNQYGRKIEATPYHHIVSIHRDNIIWSTGK